MSRQVAAIALVSLVALAGCGGTSPSGGSSSTGSSTASSGTSAAPAGGAVSTPTACPVSTALASETAKEPMEVSPVAVGDGTFHAETVGGITTYFCGYSATKDPSNYSLNMHIEFVLGSDAAKAWAARKDFWPSATPVARLGDGAAEQIDRDEPGKRDLTLVVHGDAYLLVVGVAAYGTNHTMPEVRAMADALAGRCLTAFGAR